MRNIPDSCKQFTAIPGTFRDVAGADGRGCTAGGNLPADNDAAGQCGNPQNVATVTKHTPGPWAWQKFGVEYYLTGQHGMRPIVLSVGQGQNRKRIIKLLDSHGLLVDFHPLHPDARLIAAAPDLLRQRDALREALAGIFQMIESGELVRDVSKDGDPSWAMTVVPLVTKLNQARAALALCETKG